VGNFVTAAKPGKAGRAAQEKIPPQEQGKARDIAASMVGANPYYVSDAKKIEHDAPELLDHVKQGTLSIPQAKMVAPSLTDRLLASPLLAEDSLILVLGGKLLPYYEAPTARLRAPVPRREQRHAVTAVAVPDIGGQKCR
jgi:hypothetical protein